MAWLTSSSAYACSCSLASAEGNAQQTTIIFKGFAVEGPTSAFEDRNHYKFSPTKIYKGRKNIFFSIYSTSGIKDTCGRFFEKNTEYMVFAYEQRGKLFTNFCSSWPILNEYSSKTKEVEEYFNQRK
jgi:hypothetical protein